MLQCASLSVGLFVTFCHGRMDEPFLDIVCVSNIFKYLSKSFNVPSSIDKINGF